MFKKFMLAALLALSFSVSAEELDRNELYQACTASSRQAGVPSIAGDPICECTAQFLAYSLDANKNVNADFTIEHTDPLIGVGVGGCVDLFNSMPDVFINTFGSTNAAR